MGLFKHERGNPFHTRRYRAIAKLAPIFRLFGLTLCIQRCDWLPGRWMPVLVKIEQERNP